MKQYTATANDDGVRLSRFVQSVTRDFPTSLLYKSFRNKRVKVNGKKAVPEYRIQAGDLIELTGIPTRRVLSALTVLEIEHLVTQHSGKRYARAVNLTE